MTLEDVIIDLKSALSKAKSIGMDVHFISELDHLIVTANHNIEVGEHETSI